MNAPLNETQEYDYGDELWFGGHGHGMLTAGEWTAGGSKKSEPGDWEELKSQQKLIAAAPRMLEALQYVLPSVGHEERRIVEEAIASATGRQS